MPIKGTAFIICARITFCKENVGKAREKAHLEDALSVRRNKLDNFDRKYRVK